MMDASRDPMTLEGLWQLVRRRSGWLIACFALTVGCGLVYLQLAQPVHMVRARILVEPQSLSAERVRAERDKDFLATQAEIIRSPAVVGRAVETLGLPAAAPGEPNPMLTILESLRVNPLLGTNVLSVSLQGPDAAEATRTVEAVIESYREYIRTSERGAHLETLSALTASEKKIREDLQGLEAEYRQLRQESPLVGRDDGAGLHRQMLAHLGETLADARSQRMELENRVAMLKGLHRSRLVTADATPVLAASVVRVDQASAASPAELPRPTAGEFGAEESGAGESGAGESGAEAFGAGEWDAGPAYTQDDLADLAHIREQLLAAQDRQKELSEKYGEKHAAMRGVREQIAHWQQQLRSRTDAAPAVLEQELDTARAQEQQLVGLYEEEFSKAKDVDHWLLEEQQALAHIQRTQEVHESILSQVRQWQLVDQALAQGKSGVAVKVLEQPALAEQQVWPPKLLVLGACGMIGLIGGLGLVLTVGNPPVETSRALTGEPRQSGPAILERIPGMAGVSPRRSASGGRLSMEPDSAAAHIVLDSPDSPAAAAFDRLAGYLEGATGDASGAALQISAVAASQRATTTTTNLALSLAREGHKVVVVDADLRRGKLGEMLHVFGSSGLASVLCGHSLLEDALQRSPLAAVDVLSRGRLAAGSELPTVGSSEFVRVLESLRSQYDFVLVDAPAVPMLGGDSFATARAADAVLLVSTVAAGGSEAAQQAYQRLNQGGARVLGVVLYQAAPSVIDGRQKQQAALV